MEEANRIYKPVEFGWLIALSTRDGSSPLASRRRTLPRIHLGPVRAH
jgi:hypothetical protein